MMNDAVDESGLFEIFNNHFKDYIIDPGGNILKDEQGEIRPAWNAKWNAFLESVPDLEEKLDLQRSLNPLLNAIR